MSVSLDMPVQVVERSNGSVAVIRGPLNYAVEIEYNTTSTEAWR